jgi:hypothetical protein
MSPQGDGNAVVAIVPVWVMILRFCQAGDLFHECKRLKKVAKAEVAPQGIFCEYPSRQGL